MTGFPPHHPRSNAWRTLDVAFHRIQEAAVDENGKRLVYLPCPDASKHKCTGALLQLPLAPVGLRDPERGQRARPCPATEDAASELHDHPPLHRPGRQDEGRDRVRARP